jgi:hypothetical protein
LRDDEAALEDETPLESISPRSTSSSSASSIDTKDGPIEASKASEADSELADATRQHPSLRYSSFFFLQPENIFRRFCFRIATSTCAAHCLYFPPLKTF